MEEHMIADHSLVEHANADHARVVLVDWTLGNACSYACSYCPGELHDGSVAWQSAAQVMAFFTQLRRHYADQRGRTVWLQFTGGEPTMHPQIIRLLQAASEQGFQVSLISNASRTLRFWEKITPCLDGVILTYHNEFADLDHFRAVGRILEARMPVHINVTMHPDRFDRTRDEALSLRAALPRATITLKPLRIGFGSALYDYTPEQEAVLEQGLRSAVPHGGRTPRGVMSVLRPSGTRQVLRANELVMRGENRWKGFRCNAGLESLRVKADGVVTRAVCSVGGDLGRLGEDVALPSAPVLCSKEVCGCVADILISKAAMTA